MATRSARIIELAQAIGADIKNLRSQIGVLADLDTSAKTSLVEAINEIVTTSIGGIINDAGTVGATTTTWSTDKIIAALTSSAQDIKDDILDGAGTAFDTLKELATALGDDPAFATTIMDALGLRLRVDAVQTFTEPQKTQARTNIGAISQSEVVTLYGDPDHNFLAEYTASKV